MEIKYDVAKYSTPYHGIFLPHHMHDLVGNQQ
jgi:hypothetical protein